MYPAAFFACHRRHGNEKRLTGRQWQILAHLGRLEAVRPSELAKHLGVSAATVSVSLDRLEREGLVERVPHREDGRAKRVCSTAEGERAMLASSDLDVDAVAELLAGMTASEREDVEKGLRTLAAALQRGTLGKR